MEWRLAKPVLAESNRPCWRHLRDAAAVSGQDAAPRRPQNCRRPKEGAIRQAGAERAAVAPRAIYQCASSRQRLQEARDHRTPHSPQELLPSAQRKSRRQIRPSSGPGVPELRAGSLPNGDGPFQDGPARLPDRARSNSGRTGAGGCRSTIPRRRRPDSEGKTSLCSAKITPARAEMRTGFPIWDRGGYPKDVNQSKTGSYRLQARLDGDDDLDCNPHPPGGRCRRTGVDRSSGWQGCREL